MHNNKKILDELVAMAEALTNERVAGNKSVTAITVSGGGDSKTYLEPAFSGCGAVWFEMDSKDWRLAKSLGFKKGYRSWTYGRRYWNGQFGDACNGYPTALSELNTKYPNSFLDKVGNGSWID